MSDVAEFGINIDYSSVDNAKQSLQGLTQQSGQTQGALQNLNTNSDKAAGGLSNIASKANLAKLGIAALVTGIAAFTINQINKFATAGDEINKMSQRLGVASDELQKLQYAARFSDVSVNGLERGISSLNILMNDYTDGNKKAVETVNKFGISLVNANGDLKSSTELFKTVSERIAETNDPLERAAIATSVFGDKLGRELMPMLLEGQAGLEKFGDEAERTNNIIGQDALDASTQYMDALEKVRAAKEGLVRWIMGPVIRALGNMITRFDDARAAGLSLAQTIRMVFSDGSVFDQLSAAVKGAENDLAAFYRMRGTDRDRWHSTVLAQEERLIATLVERRNALNQLEEQQAQTARSTVRDLEAIPEVLDSAANSIDGVTRGMSNTRKEVESAVDAADLFNQKLKAMQQMIYQHQDATLFRMALAAAAEYNEELQKLLQREVEVERQHIQNLRTLQMYKDAMTDEQYREARANIIAIYEQEQAELKRLEAAYYDAANATDTFNESLHQGVGAGIQDYINGIQSMTDAIQGGMTNALQAAEDAFVSWVSTGKMSVQDLARTIVAQIARMIFQYQMLAFWQQITGQRVGAAPVVDRSFAPATPFAKGGLVDSPTFFNYGGNKRGVAGEAGVEAILPLARNSRGELGVMASSSSGGNTFIANVKVEGGNTNADTGQAVSRAMVDTFKSLARQEIAAAQRPGGISNPMSRI